MRTFAISVLIVVAAAGALLGIRKAFADTSDEPPEFFFTRLAYYEDPNGCCRHRGGFRGGGMMAIPDPFICPEFGGGNFFPRQGFGWAIDYPGGDCKFMGGIHRLTGMRVSPNPNVVGIKDPKLFNFPFVYVVEPGGMYFDDQDAKTMREYFQRGGFLFADDFWGLRELGNFTAQMRKVFPERQLEVVPLTDEIFHTFFDVDSLIQIPNQGAGCGRGPTWEVRDDIEPRVYGIRDDSGKLMVIATYNSDLGDAWEYMDLPCYPEKYSGQAYRIGMDAMIYSMTH